MSTDENKAIARRLIAAFSDQEAAAIDELVAPDYVFHNPGDPTMPPGPAGLKHMHDQWGTAFPDVQTTIDDQIAEGDKVVTRWTTRGTHRGEFFGIAPTGKRIEFTGIYIDRVAGGKVVEHWDEADILGVFQQLGAGPAPGQRG